MPDPIVSPALKADQVVSATLTNLATSPSVNLTHDDAQDIKPAIVKEMTAVITNATNQEPFYQSRVTIGAIIAIVGAGYTLGLDFTDGTPPTVDALTAQAGIIFGGLMTLYGRYVATKPIGE